jgi:serine/threonine-protein kinase HipA
VADRYTTATVALWGHTVGAVSEHTATGKIAFEYEPTFGTSGLEISPLKLPLDLRGPQTFPELRRSTAFLGLPGVLADALPDRFGNAVIRRYFERRNRPQDALSPVQKLLYIGKRGMGALEFSPATELDRSPATEEAIELQMLVEQSRRIIEGDTSVAIPEMMKLGGSAGGARPKALIQWNRASDEIRSPFAPSGPGDEQWLVKFDGVTRDSGGLGHHADFTSQPWGRVEYVYSLMAVAAGINMSECALIQQGDLAHFATRRFDIEDGQRLHLHTLGGLVHVDFNDQYVYSYESYFDSIRALGLGQAAINEAYRRLIFALATINYDDHVKNFAFVMQTRGEWSLSPAYDVTYAADGEWTRRHQMSANGKFADHTRADLLEVGAKFDVPANGDRIIDEVVAVLSIWPEEARVAGLDTETIARFDARFIRF